MDQEKKEIIENKNIVKEVLERLTSLNENDCFMICITKLYNDGTEDRLNHYVAKNKFKDADIPLSLEEYKKILKQE